MKKSKRERRAEAVERLVQLKRLDEYTDASIMDAIFRFANVDEWLSFTHDVAIDAFIDLLSEDECEMELSTDMSVIRCSKCHGALPKGSNPSIVRYCQSCGAKVV